MTFEDVLDDAPNSAASTGPRHSASFWTARSRVAPRRGDVPFVRARSTQTMRESITLLSQLVPSRRGCEMDVGLVRLSISSHRHRSGEGPG